MTTYRFQYETSTYAPGETETLDPVTIAAETREFANDAMRAYAHENGGRVVLCQPCCDDPLLVGEEICPNCVAFALSVVLTDDMRAALAVIVVDGPGVCFGHGSTYKHLTAGASYCVFNGLATYDATYQSYSATEIGRAAYEAVQS